MTLPPDANGTIYRVPVINFNKKPFNGRQYNQSLGTKEEVWNEDDTRYRPAKRPKHSFDKIDKNMEEQTVQTHFVSIPLALNDIDIQRSYLGFRETLLADSSLKAVSGRQFSSQHFTHPNMLHLTLI